MYLLAATAPHETSPSFVQALASEQVGLASACMGDLHIMCAIHAG